MADASRRSSSRSWGRIWSAFLPPGTWRRGLACAPPNQESAGKRYSGKTRKGDPWLREALVEAALSAGRTRTTYLAAQYRRLAARRGKKTAAVAVAHTILVVVYHLLTRAQDYVDLGSTYFDERDRQAVQRQLVRRLEALGLKVTVEPTTPAA